MKPSSGVNAPMPIMIRSQVSRDVIGISRQGLGLLDLLLAGLPFEEQRFQFRTAVRRDELAHEPPLSCMKTFLDVRGTVAAIATVR